MKLSFGKALAAVTFLALALTGCGGSGGNRSNLPDGAKSATDLPIIGSWSVTDNRVDGDGTTVTQQIIFAFTVNQMNISGTCSTPGNPSVTVSGSIPASIEAAKVTLNASVSDSKPIVGTTSTCSFNAKPGENFTYQISGKTLNITPAGSTSTISLNRM